MDISGNGDPSEQSDILTVRWQLDSGIGHQDAYALVLKPLLKAENIVFVDGDGDGDPEVVFFPTLDFNYSALLRSCLRSLFGGPRTVALLLRPQTCIRPVKPVHFVKQLLFRLLRRAPNIAILTIMPFSVEPRLASFSKAWIQDPQLWDLAIIAPSALEPPTQPGPGRKIVVMLGVLSSLKGFDKFARLWIGEECVRNSFRFIAAGTLDPDLGDLAEAFVRAGGELVNERISDEQIYAYYRTADMVWCAYDPSYDQASGIFGRAFQLGIPSIVTAQSMVHKQAQALGQDVLALVPDEAGSFPGAAKKLLSWEPQRVSAGSRAAVVTQMRNRDVNVLAAILRGRPDH